MVYFDLQIRCKIESFYSQWKIFFLAGFVWTADAMEILLVYYYYLLLLIIMIIIINIIIYYYCYYFPI